MQINQRNRAPIPLLPRCPGVRHTRFEAVNNRLFQFRVTLGNFLKDSINFPVPQTRGFSDYYFQVDVVDSVHGQRREKLTEAAIRYFFA